MGSWISSLRPATGPADVPLPTQIQDLPDDPTLDDNASKEHDGKKISVQPQNKKALFSTKHEEPSSSSTKRTRTSSSVPKKHVKRRRMPHQDDNLWEHEDDRKDAGVAMTSTEDSLDASVQPGSIAHALYTMVSDSGEVGLSIREAGSKLMEQGLFLEQTNIPRIVQVSRAMRTNPYFVETTAGRFILWSTFLKGKDPKIHSLKLNQYRLRKPKKT